MTRKSGPEAPPKPVRAEDVEIRLLLEGIFQYYGHDFRQYDPARIRERILACLREEKLDSVSQYQHRVLRDRSCLERLTEGLASGAPGLFDPPGFWLLLRRKVVPLLRTYPSSKLWVAGCGTGEEAYSLAILLQEEGLGSRAMIYATDIDETVLARARQGWIPRERLHAARRKYSSAGGRKSLLNHGRLRKGGCSLEPTLSGRVVFATHSLATDSSFNEFNVILCRSALSWFSPPLKGRACSLLHQSLGLFGYLGLGPRESMKETRYGECYEPFSARNRLYRRVR